MKRVMHRPLPFLIFLGLVVPALLHAGNPVEDESLIFTAARLPQAPQESPAAVTVIDQEMIRLSGARKIADLMLLVPGMQVGSKVGNLQSVAYHGMTDEYSRRMQVLVDGRSIYSPAMGGVYWLDLPVQLDEIVRIEVIRGTNTVNYGSNAFLATINIITRPARESTGGRVSVLVGSHGERDVQASYGFQHGRWAGSLNALSQRDDGYTRTETPIHDDRRLKALNGRFELDAGRDDELSLALGISTADKGIGGDPAVNGLAEGGPERETTGENDYQYLQWHHGYNESHYGVLRLSRSRDAQTDDGYLLSHPLLPSPLVIAEGYDSERLDAEYEHSTQWSGTLRTSAGLAWREDRIESPSFLGSAEKRDNTIRRAFANAEWRMLPSLTLNLGGMLESSSFNPAEFSPRIAALWHAQPGHTWRVGYAEGRRTPFFYERQGVKSYTTLDGSARVYSVIASSLLDGGDGLRTEHVRSLELAYLYRPSRMLGLDARLFRDHLSDMIKPTLRPETGVLTSLPGLVGDFANLGEVHLHGLELQLDARPAEGWRLHASYAWTRIEEQSPIEQVAGQSYAYDRSAPRHAGSLLVGKRLEDGWTVSGVYSHVGAMRWLWYTYPMLETQDRLDLRLEKRFRVGGQGLRMELVGQYLLGEQSDFLPTRRWQPGIYGRLTLDLS